LLKIYIVILIKEDLIEEGHSVLVIMAVFSTTLFAAPLSLTGSADQQSRETCQSFKVEVLEEDLFAEVQAVALSPEEAQAVEGEGFLISSTPPGQVVS
jgi:hypothetical protein